MCSFFLSVTMTLPIGVVALQSLRLHTVTFEDLACNDYALAGQMVMQTLQNS